MNIEIIGKKSSNQIKLLKNIRKAIETTKLDTRPQIYEIVSSKKYQIENAPALIINEDVISEGKVLTEREISKYLKKYDGIIAYCRD